MQPPQALSRPAASKFLRWISSQARRLIRPARREKRSPSRICHPYFARSGARAREEWRSRLTLPDSPAVNTYSLPWAAAIQTGVLTSAPLWRKVARLT